MIGQPDENIGELYADAASVVELATVGSAGACPGESHRYTLTYPAEIVIGQRVTFRSTPIDLLPTVSVAALTHTFIGAADGTFVGAPPDFYAFTPSFTSFAPGAYTFAVQRAARLSTGALQIVNFCGVVNLIAPPPPARPTAAIVSAIDYRPSVAPGGLAALFGTNLTTETIAARDLPLPTELGGLSIKLVSSNPRNTREFSAGLLYVSPQQINFVLPEYGDNQASQLPDGLCRFTVYRGSTEIAWGETMVGRVAPGLATIAASGKGPAAGYLVRVAADGTQTQHAISAFDNELKAFVSLPIDLGDDSDREFLILYGTGLRYRNPTKTLLAYVDSSTANALTPAFAGAAPGFAGLDQLNIELPSRLRGKGKVVIGLDVEGASSNHVEIVVR
jgi:uncharacterized protein (TIGR03437 family)